MARSALPSQGARDKSLDRKQQDSAQYWQANCSTFSCISAMAMLFYEQIFLLILKLLFYLFFKQPNLWAFQLNAAFLLATHSGKVTLVLLPTPCTQSCNIKGQLISVTGTAVALQASTGAIDVAQLRQDNEKHYSIFQ